MPRTEVYVRERLPLTVKLQVGAVRVGDVQYPSVPGDGFALDKFPEPSQRREQTARGPVQAVEFVTTLTPLRSGTLIVGPATMGMSVLVQNRRRSPFLGGFFGDESRPVQLASEPLVLTVLPLPSEGRPGDFSGAVGTFTFEVTAQPRDVAVGDPVTVRSVVRGTGSLDGLAPPAIAASDALRVYPTQTSQAGDDPSARAFEQVLIPLHDGRIDLPALRFAYFDPAARAYRVLAPPPVALTVRPSAQAKAAPQIVGGTAARSPQRPETLGRDLVFIKDAPGRLVPVGSRRHRSALFWAVQVVPVLAWAGVVAWDRRRRRLAGDTRYARYTRAGREARAALVRAREALARGDATTCHDAAAAALRDYLAAKLDLPPGAVVDTAAPRLRSAGIDGEVAAEVAAFFASCEEARFAPGGGSRADLERTLVRADAIVRALERARGLEPVAALLLVGLVAAGGVAGAAAPEGPTALFFRGNALYGDERYAEAAALYEKIVADGVESEALHFNLGNAWFKAGDVGHAVLAYERAARLAPGDPDLAANLAYARELAGDVPDESLLTRLAFPLAARFATDTLATAAAVAWWAVFLLLAAARLVPRAGRGARLAAALAGVAGLAAATSAGYRVVTLEAPTWAVVVGHAETTVRYEPYEASTAFFGAKPGTVLRVLGTHEDWSKVAGRDGRRGWVATAVLATL